MLHASEIRAVNNLIRVIIGTRVVSEIAGASIGSNPINVANLLPIWARAMERGRNNLVDRYLNTLAIPG